MVDLKSVLQDRAVQGVVEELVPLLEQVFEELDSIHKQLVEMRTAKATEEGHNG